MVRVCSERTIQCEDSKFSLEQVSGRHQGDMCGDRSRRQLYLRADLSREWSELAIWFGNQLPLGKAKGGDFYQRQ